MPNSDLEPTSHLYDLGGMWIAGTNSLSTLDFTSFEEASTVYLQSAASQGAALQQDVDKLDLQFLETSWSWFDVEVRVADRERASQTPPHTPRS